MEKRPDEPPPAQLQFRRYTRPSQRHRLVAASSRRSRSVSPFQALSFAPPPCPSRPPQQASNTPANFGSHQTYPWPGRHIHPLRRGGNAASRQQNEGLQPTPAHAPSRKQSVLSRPARPLKEVSAPPVVPKL